MELGKKAGKTPEEMVRGVDLRQKMAGHLLAGQPSQVDAVAFMPDQRQALSSMDLMK